MAQAQRRKASLHSAEARPIRDDDMERAPGAREEAEPLDQDLGHYSRSPGSSRNHRACLGRGGFPAAFRQGASFRLPGQRSPGASVVGPGASGLSVIEGMTAAW